MSYKQKYLKYKLKYLKLQKQNVQKQNGGTFCTSGSDLPGRSNSLETNKSYIQKLFRNTAYRQCGTSNCNDNDHKSIHSGEILLNFSYNSNTDNDVVIDQILNEDSFKNCYQSILGIACIYSTANVLTKIINKIATLNNNGEFGIFGRINPLFILSYNLSTGPKGFTSDNFYTLLSLIKDKAGIAWGNMITKNNKIKHSVEKPTNLINKILTMIDMNIFPNDSIATLNDILLINNSRYSEIKLLIIMLQQIKINGYSNEVDTEINKLEFNTRDKLKVINSAINKDLAIKVIFSSEIPEINYINNYYPLTEMVKAFIEGDNQISKQFP
jgi:hypothetical protein